MSTPAKTAIRPDRIQAIKRLPINTLGRDLVVGDLHGCRSYLEAELDRLNFDPSADRVICVGDLADRGPDPMGTLGLLREPWFHAVISNHDAMMLTYCGKYFSHLHRPFDFTNNGGFWINEFAGDAKTPPHPDLVDILDRVMALPAVLCVDAEIPFNVTHGELPKGGKTQAGLLTLETLRTMDRHDADEAVWARDQIKAALRGGSLRKAEAGGQTVIMTGTPIDPDLNLTYVGHTVLQKPVMHKSYAYIDTGAYKRVTGKSKDCCLTIIDHEQFAPKLLALARMQADAKSTLTAS